MSQDGVTHQEARAIKKKITLTMLLLIFFGLGAGAALFIVNKPAHAQSASVEETTFDKIPERLRTDTIAPEASESGVGESVDFSKGLISMRSKEAQEALGTSYRVLRALPAIKNLQINTAYDAPLPRAQRFVLEAPVETVDEAVVRRDDIEKKEPVVSNPTGGSGSTAREGGEGTGAARMVSIKSNIPEEFRELFEEMIIKVQAAEKLWDRFVKGDRSEESFAWLKEAKGYLVFVRDGFDQIREVYENVPGLDQSSSHVLRLIYDINKTYIG